MLPHHARTGRCARAFSTSSGTRPSEFNLQSVYVNAVMATTLSRFAEMVTPEDVVSGFLARFLPMVATEKITRKRLSKATTETEQAGQNLTEDLKKMYQRLAESPKAMRITDDALNRLDLAEQDLEAWAAQQFHADLIQPWGKRLSENTQRLSVIFAVSEGQDAVEKAHVLRAVECIDRAKEDVQMLVGELMKAPVARKLDKVERFIRANPGISARDLQRKTGMSAKEMQEVTVELSTQGRIFVKLAGDNRPRYYPGSRPGSSE